MGEMLQCGNGSNNTSLLEGKINDHKVNVLIDTGADLSVLSQEMYSKLNTNKELIIDDSEIPSVKTVSGDNIVLQGAVEIPQYQAPNPIFIGSLQHLLDMRLQWFGFFA